MSDRIEVLYILKYPEQMLRAAAERLVCSMQSLESQPVRIIIVNYSRGHLPDRIRYRTGIQYCHHPIDADFSRAKAINFAVKRYITADYFAVSDIDLVYDRSHFISIREMLASRHEDRPLRIINYNFNIIPRHPMFYTANRLLLRLLRKSSGGYAHGNGIIHLPSFKAIQGYDEELIGYGPEDDLFNCRIGRINELKFLPDDKLTTYHLWHPVSAYNAEQFEKNMNFWLKEKIRIWGLPAGDVAGITANHAGSWGEFA
jgi:hypothetical protein